MMVLDFSEKHVQRITLPPDASIIFGNNYRAGSYILQVLQGKQKITRTIAKF